MSVDPQRLDNLNDLLDKLFAARKVYRAACLAEVQARVEVDRAMAVFNEAVDRGRRGDLAPTGPLIAAERAYLGEVLNARKSTPWDYLDKARELQQAQIRQG